MVAAHPADESVGGEVVIAAHDLTKLFRVYDSPWQRLAWLLGARSTSAPHEISSLIDISIDVLRGECLGIMGPNGAGKTTLLRIILGALFPTSGTLMVRQKPMMLDLGTGMSPDLTGRQNLLTAGLASGFGRRELADRMNAMIEFSELGDEIDYPLKTYSTGMTMRLAFSLYAHLEPEILIIDEAFAVGDARFVLKCTRMLRRLLRSGTTILLASHDAAAVRELCDRALVLHHGRIQHLGDPGEAVEAYHAILGVSDRAAPATGDGGEGQVSERERPVPETVERFLAECVDRRSPGFHSRDAEILGVKVYRNGERASGVFRHRDECTVEWLIKCVGTHEVLTSGVHVHAQLGAYVFGTSYVHLGHPLHVRERGHYVLAISFPMLFGPGKYVLSVGVAEPHLHRHSKGGQQLDRLLSAYEFEIQDFELEDDEAIPFFGLVDVPATVHDPVFLPLE